MKQCTLHLDFFAENKSIDPQDKLKSHYNGCKLLRYARFPKGHMIFKYKDVSENFYINLSGKIGIFIPRTRDEIQEELRLVFDASDNIPKEQKAFDEESFNAYLKRTNLDRKFRFGASRTNKYDLIARGKIVYNNEYLKENLGGLDYTTIPENSDFFLSEMVRKFTLET